MSIQPYTRAWDQAESAWDVDVHVLAKEVEADLPGKKFRVRGSGTDVEFRFEDALTSAEVTVLAGRVSTHKTERPAAVLLYHQGVKIGEIRQRTEELTEEGFEYPASSGKFISLSASSRVNIAEANDKRLTLMTFPVDWSYVDQRAGKLTIADADAMNTFYLTGLAAYRALEDADTVLMDEARAGTSKASVDAVVDSR